MKKKEIAELSVEQRAIKALGQEGRDDELKALAAKSTHIVEITNPDGYEQVHGARMELKSARCEIQRLGKTAREDATKFTKAVIAEEKRLIGLIEPEEERLQKLQDEHDAAIEAEKQAKIEAEQQRVIAIQSRIKDMSGLIDLIKRNNFTAAQLEEHMLDLGRLLIDDSFEEFEEEARITKTETLKAAQEYLVAAQKREHEQALLKAAREELEKQRAEDERLRKEIESRRAEEQKRLDAEAQAEKAHQAEELRREREKIEAQRLAERDKLLEERRKFEQEKAALEAEQRAAREAREAEDAERARVAAEAKRVEDERIEAERQERESKEAEDAERARIAAIQQPSLDEILDVLANHYRVPRERALAWLESIAVSETLGWSATTQFAGASAR